MLYGVFADVHSNLEAFDAVLGFFKEKKIQNFINAGDIVGYGPNPNECIQRLNSLKRVYCIAGNHDKAVVGMKPTSWFNSYAQRALLWTKRKLTVESRNFLMRLSTFYEHTYFSVAHGSPRDSLDEYLLSPVQFMDNVDHFKTQICFIGHTHMPVCFIKDKMARVKIRNLKDEDKTKIGHEIKSVYNLGSVGQPRDNDARACCAVYDTDTMGLSFHRIKYNIEKTQKKMMQAMMPLFLIDRIGVGR